ncbi:AraC-like DNA-binding protein [Hasllibacter halocynthiae]|uniref:AraC-like DNA-binding protein n=1 Tax=Hasllibacter halocynthiae TaxID=595589 RepID=A0A2T0X859_9RHOB|nr:AraC family transcriptional regulator [Hasllibacter halocynthiae]PRY95085.1 AraC-like DNA-binding protein [Hasllibacter halocynthiae]
MNTQVRIDVPLDTGSDRRAATRWRRLWTGDDWADTTLHARPHGLALRAFRNGVRALVEGLPVEVAPWGVLWVPAGLPFALTPGRMRGRILEVRRSAGLPVLPVMGQPSPAEADVLLTDPVVALRVILARGHGLGRPTASQRIVRAFAHQLELGFHAGLRVQDHADRLGITATHLSRVCKAATGSTAVRLCTNRTILEARRLLVETGRPVGEVGASLGYASPSYFTRDFQLRCGTTPSAFRTAARLAAAG